MHDCKSEKLVFLLSREISEQGANYLCGVVIINRGRRCATRSQGRQPSATGEKKKKRKAVSRFSRCRPDLVGVKQERKTALSVLRFDGSGKPQRAACFSSPACISLSPFPFYGKQCHCVVGDVYRVRHLFHTNPATVSLNFEYKKCTFLFPIGSARIYNGIKL